ncbi:kinesin [Aspergillus ellipticus CBS 707.79]|uniref:Kinesin n=1 Tax=Aspergillus ellipticus CBS 707.79 TaxID=1448320 RepID=A0A319D8K8_9EURO|nr:kinesin [Aspergillus ellipticus CBS 707.79]
MNANTWLSPGDYTVGWICALPIELAAAQAMLDETHQTIPLPPNDHNTYSLGRIGSHNVVMACLPNGEYGTASAAVVAMQMLSTFPSVHHGLMVDIGGGIPGDDADIRLGDIVVSQPTGSYGGVVQYDYGKALEGHFQRTGMLNRPPQSLLTALTKLQARHLRSGNNIPEILHQMYFLFPTYYSHMGSTNTCNQCDKSNAITRAPREVNAPVVHYGLIASGNWVVKDSKVRDRLQREFGAYCVDMEAAGLMNNFPCVVIRGICDYADSHKNKEWQGYAAAVAAAYAKELLSEIPRGIHLIPFHRNPRFIGREAELGTLKSKISTRGQSRKAALCGLGGVGKTQIALEVVYKVQENHPDCLIFWISSTSRSSVEQGFTTIAQALGLEETQADAKSFVKSYFSQEQRPWLLIIDNADDTEMWMQGQDSSPALKHFLPSSASGYILFTTRDKQLALRFASPDVFMVPDVDESAARDILKEHLLQKELIDDDDATSALLHQLTFLPLAIIQATAYINKTGIDIATYLSLRYPDIQNPVATTWLVSFHRIRQLNALAADYLSAMACMDHRNIPLSLLPRSTSLKKRIDAIGLLNAYSFINMQVRDTSLSLHRLVHLATRGWLKKENMLQEWIRRVADRFDETFPVDEIQNRKLWREYLPQFQALILNEEFLKIRHNYLSLNRRVQAYFYRDGRYAEAEVLLTDLLQRTKEELGDAHEETLDIIGDLVSVLVDQGRLHEAEQLEIRVKEGIEMIHGPQHPHTLKSMLKLAGILQSLGRFSMAEDLELQVLAIRHQLFGPEDPSTVASMQHLFMTYIFSKRWNEAGEIGVQLVASREKVLGPEHPNTVSSKCYLATAYHHQGQWAKSQALASEVLRISSRGVLSEHPDTMSHMVNLALLYHNQGRWKEAQEVDKQVVAMNEQTLGPDHPNTLRSMSVLALSYSSQGQWEDAAKLQTVLVEKSKQVLGPQHPETLITAGNLASIWKSMGRHDEAVVLMGECIRCSETLLGREHPHTLTFVETYTYWMTPAIPEIKGKSLFGK